ncbi:hypothetical protein [Marivita sp.]|uniref:hypothetical protein n=1 Tax=Marivita sp. TaxID=2003365 RepID=UPI003F6EC370
MLDAIQTTRRRMLLGLAAASTAAATGASSGGHTATLEDPQLLELGDALPSALKDFKDAETRVKQIEETWGAQWPVPDSEIIRYGSGCKTHRDILGRGVEMPWGKSGVTRVHDLGTPEHFEKSAVWNWKEYERCMGLKSKRGSRGAKLWAERDEAAIEPARAYWSEVERITKASGIEAARKAEDAALETLKKLVGEIILYREQTITGLIIKAQALQAWGEVPTAFQQINSESPNWGDAIASTVIRQTQGDA